MTMEHYVREATAILDRQMPRRMPAELRAGQPFMLREKKLFAPNERVKVQIHHPAWARAPLPQPHSHDFFELCYVHAGEFIQLIEGHQIRQTPDSVILLRPGATHATWIERESDIVFNILVRRSVVAESLLQVVSPKNPIREFLAKAVHAPVASASHLEFSSTPSQVGLVESIIADYYDGQADFDDVILGHVLLLFAELAMHPLAKSDDRDPVTADILTYIAERYLIATQESVARHFNYSSRHLSRLLGATTGKTFPELVNGHKIDSICRRLQTEGTPISQLVREMGYNDINYFYRVFKRVRGMSFGDYRRALVDHAKASA